MKNNLNYNSVENLPTMKARAVFQVNSASVFKEDIDILPVSISDNLKYMPWGGDNNMHTTSYSLSRTMRRSPLAKSSTQRFAMAAVWCTTAMTLTT
nr:MAG TPA: hypothetical protein [Caudoviricetes sp.]